MPCAFRSCASMPCSTSHWSARRPFVRSTRMLVMHEFRRYVRIPVMTEVGITTADGGA